MAVSNGPNIPVMINALTGDNFDVDFRKFLRAFSALVLPLVLDHTLAAPPGSPANGDRYIVGGSPTGAWATHANHIAVWTMDNPASPSGVWEFYVPLTGWGIFSITAGVALRYSGSAWVKAASGSLATYAVASLPASPGEGAIAFATNGRKVGEGGGAGTGVPVYFSSGSWRVYATDAAVAV